MLILFCFVFCKNHPNPIHVQRNVIRCIHVVLIDSFQCSDADNIIVFALTFVAKRESPEWSKNRSNIITNTHAKFSQLHVNRIDRLTHYEKRSKRIIVVRATSCDAKFNMEKRHIIKTISSERKKLNITDVWGDCSMFMLHSSSVGNVRHKWSNIAG